MSLSKSGKGHMLSTRTFSQVAHVSYRLNVKVTSRERRKHEFTEAHECEIKRVREKDSDTLRFRIMIQSRIRLSLRWNRIHHSRPHMLPAGSLWCSAGCFSEGGGVLLIELGCLKAEHRFCVPCVGASRSLKRQRD